MKDKLILNVWFLGIKTSQRRLIMNMLNVDFLVNETKTDIDVLFVNEMKDYDINYKLIFPYNEIIMEQLNDIIFNVISKHKKPIKQNKPIKTEKTITKVINKNTSVNLEQDLLELKSKVKIEHKDICFLNNVYDEVYFFNKNDAYEEWKVMNKLCIDNNLYIKRMEYVTISYDFINSFINDNPNSFIIVDEYFDNIDDFINVKYIHQLQSHLNIMEHHI